MDELEQAILELRQHYRNTFDSPSGRVVLFNLLAGSSFFESIDPLDIESIGRRNMMLKVVKMLVDYEGNPDRISEVIINALLQQPIKEYKEYDGIRY